MRTSFVIELNENGDIKMICIFFFLSLAEKIVFVVAQNSMKIIRIMFLVKCQSSKVLSAENGLCTETKMYTITS